jgi:hypothetical protein
MWWKKLPLEGSIKRLIFDGEIVVVSVGKVHIA